MSAELIARYRADASRSAELAALLSVAVVTGEVADGEARAYALADIRQHNRNKERMRQQADALENNPTAWVRTGPAWLD